MAKLDWRKPHELHGSGPGRDVVIQNNQLFDRAGNPLPGDLKSIAAKGIPVTKEVAVQIATAKARKEAEEKKRKLDEYVEKVRQQLASKLTEEGDIDIPPEEVLEKNPIDGLEELEAELRVTQPKGSKVRKRKSG